DIVIATGSSAINPWPGTLTLTTLDDAEQIRKALMGGPKRVVIIGAGWVGVELAHGLAAADHEITLIEAAEHPLAEHLQRAASHVRGWLDHVDLRTGTHVTSVELAGEEAADGAPAATVHTTGGSVPGDLVITAIGMRPATDWLVGTPIDRDERGFLPVDPGGRVETPQGRVWAVGDVATHSHPVFGQIPGGDRKSTRLNSSHVSISYAVFCLKKRTSHSRAPHA